MTGRASAQAANRARPTRAKTDARQRREDHPPYARPPDTGGASQLWLDGAQLQPPDTRAPVTGLQVKGLPDMGPAWHA